MTAAKGSVLIVGATSAIGRATALEYALAGWHVILAARLLEGARRTGDDISVRTGAEVSTCELDILQLDTFSSFIRSLPALPNTVVCVVGELGQQGLAQTDLVYASQVLRTNFEGPALLLGSFAEEFLKRASGTIVGVSSVAGDRGRASNYVYGSAKAGLTAFLSGLRGRLAGRGIRVVTVKPGFVRTRMTAEHELPEILTARPDEVGRAIFAAAQGRRSRDVVYVRRIWRPIMFMIRSLPETVFKRLTL